MRRLVRVIPLLAAVAATAFGASPSAAQSPQSYPYCALAETGATSCYYTSREQCGSRCISNPSYQGPQGAMANAPAWRRAPRR
jgi:hypothetical protein